MACSTQSTELKAPPDEATPVEVSAPPPVEAPPEEGLWNPKVETSADAELEALEALGYVGGETPGTGEIGVTIHDRERVAAGWNLWTSGHGPEAFLMDMEGEIHHTWRLAFAEAFPGRQVDTERPGTQYWRRVQLLPDGSLLAIFEGHGLVKVDRDSRRIWAWEGRAHHDLHVRADGTIVTLSRVPHVLPRIHPKRPVLEDFVSTLSAEGVELHRFSVLEAIEESPHRALWQAHKKAAGDLFHTNAIEVLDGRLADQVPAFAQGNILVSFRAFHAIAVLDPHTERAIWAATGSFRRQHDPRVLTNGHLLLFDNLGRPRHSAVLEYDPATMALQWSWGLQPGQELFTKFCGAASRLTNGNTLISESDNGRVIEVTREGDIVWEFHNPHRAGPDQSYVAIIPELSRVDAAAWLEVP